MIQCVTQKCSSPVDDIDAVSDESSIPVDEDGLAGRQFDLVDPDGKQPPPVAPKRRRATVSAESSE